MLLAMSMLPTGITDVSSGWMAPRSVISRITSPGPADDAVERDAERAGDAFRSLPRNGRRRAHHPEEDEHARPQRPLEDHDEERADEDDLHDPACERDPVSPSSRIFCRRATRATARASSAARTACTAPRTSSLSNRPLSMGGLHGGDPYDPAGFHREDAVRQPRRLARVVGDEDGREILVADDVGQQFLDVGFGRFVEGGGRFVEQEHLGVVGEGAGDGDALRFAAGEPRYVAVLEPVEPDAREQPGDRVVLQRCPCWSGPKQTFSATVPGKRYGACITMPMRWRSVRGGIER